MNKKTTFKKVSNVIGFGLLVGIIGSLNVIFRVLKYPPLFLFHVIALFQIINFWSCDNVLWMIGIGAFISFLGFSHLLVKFTRLLGDPAWSSNFIDFLTCWAFILVWLGGISWSLC